MMFFKNKTTNHHVLMGRKTFESIGKPLPNRTNIILTRDKDYKVENCIVVNTLEEGIEIARKNNEEELMIIGGSEIYNLSESICNRLYLTEVNDTFDCDTHFNFDKLKWEETSREEHLINDNGDNHNFSFVTYIKK
jgi:dihydrofolate reductase